MQDTNNPVMLSSEEINHYEKVFKKNIDAFVQDNPNDGLDILAQLIIGEANAVLTYSGPYAQQIDTLLKDQYFTTIMKRSIYQCLYSQLSVENFYQNDAYNNPHLCQPWQILASMFKDIVNKSRISLKRVSQLNTEQKAAFFAAIKDFGLTSLDLDFSSNNLRGYSSVVCLISASHIPQEIKKNQLIAQAKDDGLTIYWSNNGKMLARTLDKENSANILALLPHKNLEKLIEIQDKDIIQMIISKYGCTKLENINGVIETLNLLVAHHADLKNAGVTSLNLTVSHVLTFEEYCLIFEQLTFLKNQIFMPDFIFRPSPIPLHAKLELNRDSPGIFNQRIESEMDALFKALVYYPEVTFISFNLSELVPSEWDAFMKRFAASPIVQLNIADIHELSLNKQEQVAEVMANNKRQMGIGERGLSNLCLFSLWQQPGARMQITSENSVTTAQFRTDNAPGPADISGIEDIIASGEKYKPKYT